MSETVDPRNGRNEVYKEILNSINKEGKCPFCPGGYTWKNQEILKEEDGWTISQVDPRYQLKNTEYQFLLFPREHKEYMSELTPKDWSAVKILTDWAVTEFKMPATIFTMRSGDTSVTGATVKHIHAQFFVPKIEDGTPQLITVYYGPYPKKVE